MAEGTKMPILIFAALYDLVDAVPVYRAKL
jgi:hypothetical protein